MVRFLFCIGLGAGFFELVSWFVEKLELFGSSFFGSRFVPIRPVKDLTFSDMLPQ